jgi:plastocyanin
MTGFPARPALTALWVAAGGSACSSTSGPSNGGGGSPPTADVVIVQGAQVLGFQAYDPDTITVHLNGAASVKVVWRNDDETGGSKVSHTVTDTAAAPAFGRTVNAGDTVSVTFNSAGEFPYKCTFHSGMRGLVIVEP